MRCNCCKRKTFTLSCNYCSGVFCTSCIQLEIHNCPKKSDCKDKQRKELTERLKGKSKYINIEYESGNAY